MSGVRISALALLFPLIVPSVAIRFYMQSSVLFKEVAAFFKEFLPQGTKSVCAAISGGADSMALFHLLSSLKDDLGIVRLSIAHVNHSLRGNESDEDAAFVEDAARRAGLPFHLKTLRPPKVHTSVELWARRARYEFFSKLRETEHYDWIATGHTADDQAETVLMRIMRGCGLKGLCAIAPVRQDGVIRPLLYIKRNDLRDWLSRSGGVFREDSSNSAMDFARNRVRHALLPALEKREPGASAILALIARGADTAWQSLLPFMNTWIEDNVITNDRGFLIKKSGFSDNELAREAIAHVLRTKGIGFQQCHIESLMTDFKRTGGLFLLSEGWAYACRKDAIEFGNDLHGLKEITSPKKYGDFSIALAIPGIAEYTPEGMIFDVERISPLPPHTLPFSSDNLTAFLDMEIAGNSLVFRSMSRDDVFWPLGSNGLRNVKEYLKKHKKNNTAVGLVVNEKGEVLWIPGVQISHNARVTPQTRMILKISCKTPR